MKASSTQVKVALFYLIFLGGGWLIGQWLPQLVDLNITPRNEPHVHQMIMTAMALFVFASATPFVPGAEIGFGLLLLFGGKIAPLVYLGMVTALLLAFAVGRLAPLNWLALSFRFVGLEKAHDFVLSQSTISPGKRLEVLVEKVPNRFGKVLLRNRYLLIIVALNLPGNSLVGGGGGIALLAGISRLFSTPKMAATILIAVAPVPLFFFLTG